MARASAVMRLGIATGCALLTAAALPSRLWKPQLRRLGLLALLLFVLTAIGSGQTVADVGEHITNNPYSIAFWCVHSQSCSLTPEFVE